MGIKVRLSVRGSQELGLQLLVLPRSRCILTRSRCIWRGRVRVQQRGVRCKQVGVRLSQAAHHAIELCPPPSGGAATRAAAARGSDCLQLAAVRRHAAPAIVAGLRHNPNRR